MSVHTLQLTIPASGVVALSVSRTPCKEVCVQNNDTSNTARVGDSSITVANAKGQLLDKRTSGTYTNNTTFFGPYTALDVDLKDIFVTGTQNQLIDVWFVK